ncbi:7-carboxy-7-deazaguanine synthase QueE [Myxococcota bacterium]|nr:7-carboxy-7-deazaguanine synthase QueE [Myxococcota bacterium]
MATEDLAVEMNLFEIFSSIQGEGPHVGESTLFVRFGGCDLRCRWCDTPHTWRAASTCRVALDFGHRAFREISNPISVETVVSATEGLGLKRHRYASLTGGEPLLQAEAVRALSKELRRRGPLILLETHGLHVQALEHVLDVVDVVSMDWKLASDVWRAGESGPDPKANFHDEHSRFLALASRSAEVVVKVVVTPSTLDAELDEMAGRVAEHGPGACIVLQPVTPCGGVDAMPGAERLLEMVWRVNRQFPDVRLIPQTHRFYGAA